MAMTESGGEMLGLDAAQGPGTPLPSRVSRNARHDAEAWMQKNSIVSQKSGTGAVDMVVSMEEALGG